MIVVASELFRNGHPGWIRAISGRSCEIPSRARGVVSRSAGWRRAPMARRVRASSSAAAPADPGHLDGVVVDDARVCNNKLKRWEDYYNYRS